LTITREESLCQRSGFQMYIGRILAEINPTFNNCRRRGRSNDTDSGQKRSYGFIHHIYSRKGKLRFLSKQGMMRYTLKDLLLSAA
jgi:hypothetical protein